MQLALGTKPRAASQAAETLDIPLFEAAAFTYAAGTVQWLVYSGVHIELNVLDDSDLPISVRIAKVVVGEREVIVACEGAVPLDETDSRWLPFSSIHVFDLELNEFGGCVLSGWQPLSSGALEILRSQLRHTFQQRVIAELGKKAGDTALGVIEASQGVAVFMKQLGRKPILNGAAVKLRDLRGGGTGRSGPKTCGCASCRATSTSIAVRPLPYRVESS